MTLREVILADLKPLLTGSEKVPKEVLRCAEKLLQIGVWHRFSRNEVATSCQDASQKRNRLGHKGIPLWDELKSFLGEFEDSAGSRKYLLAHYRGDREINIDKLRQVLDAQGKVERTFLDINSGLNAAYGTVNPFMALNGVVHVFDYELHRPMGVPGTVMTNAGDRTWAVEFDPAELVLKLEGSRWADIIEADDSLLRQRKEPKTIGILTGNPPDSGLYLWEAINSHFRRLMGRDSLGDISMPKVIALSIPQIGISMEMDKREIPLRKALIKGVDELCDAGANIIAHPAHTTHYYASDIAAHAAERGAAFVSMADATVQKLRSEKIKEISLLGTRYVTDFSQKWSIYANAFGDIKVTCPSSEGWKKVHELGYEVQQKGPTSICFNWMRDLLRLEVPASCKHVLLGMTEFTPIARHLKTKGRQGKTLIDPIDIYGEAIAIEYLGNSSLPVRK